MAITPCEEIAIPPGVPSPLVSRVSVSLPPAPMFTICSVATSCWLAVIAARSVPSGLTAKFVRKDGENVMDDPGIGSSFPEAALNPLIFPEKFPTKNPSFAAGGRGGLMEELPPLQATASAASDVAASVAYFDLTECFRTTSGAVSSFNPDVFGSQRIYPPSPWRRNPLSIPRSGYAFDSSWKGIVARSFVTVTTAPCSFITRLPITYPSVPVTIPPKTSAT